MRILITGADGTLGRALQRGLRHDLVALNRKQLDITSFAQVRSAIEAQPLDAIINCAAMANVDAAELDETLSTAINATGVANLARACGNTRLIHVSTDYVFDGEASEPYATDAPTNPINAYGRSKLAGEAEAAKASNFAIVRTSWLFGTGRPFIQSVLNNRGEPQKIISDQVSRPTFVDDLAIGIEQLLDTPNGIYHVTNDGTASWFDLACAANPEGNFIPCDSSEFDRPAKRPSYTPLALTAPARHWREALAEALRDGAY